MSLSRAPHDALARALHRRTHTAPDRSHRSEGRPLVVLAVVAAVLTPLTGGLGFLVALAVAVLLAVQRRWRQLGVVLAAVVVLGTLWFLFIGVVPTEPEFGGDTLSISAP